MCTYDSGDVLHYERMNDSHGRGLDVWVLIIERCNCILLKGSFYGRYNSPGKIYNIGESNPLQGGRRVVPPEEWPDEIAVKVACYRLTGVTE